MDAFFLGWAPPFKSYDVGDGYVMEIRGDWQTTAWKSLRTELSDAWVWRQALVRRLSVREVRWARLWEEA